MHEIHEAHVPDEERGASWNHSRALADDRDEVAAAKQRLSKFLLRHGHCHPNRTPEGRPVGIWTSAH